MPGCDESVRTGSEAALPRLETVLGRSETVLGHVEAVLDGSETVLGRSEAVRSRSETVLTHAEAVPGRSESTLQLQGTLRVPVITSLKASAAARSHRQVSSNALICAGERSLACVLKSTL